VTIDHGLQAGSQDHARSVAALGYELGFDPVHLISVSVGTEGGPEAAARTARYAAIESVRPAEGLVLLGHTADDQAESVLLGLGRGSGVRSVAGMRPASDGYLRPLLGLRRADTEAACEALGLPVWHDPHNEDPRFRRVRLRREVIPLLEDVLDGGVAEALARTAAQLQDELDTLDVLAVRLLAQAVRDDGLAVGALDTEPAGLVNRTLKAWAESHGAGPLTAVHVAELSRLVFHWRGQGPIDLPGRCRVVRSSGTLSVLPAETLE
jgi:tRNA(Ile)-lysidine synthase